MFISFAKATMLCGVFAFNTTLNGGVVHRTSHPNPAFLRISKQVLMIRVSQESSPGAGDFDRNILGFVRALQSTGYAADFYEFGRNGPNYGNVVPVLSANTSHIFFVNAADGVSLVVVQNNSDHPENGNGGTAKMRWELSGGTAEVLLADDDSTEAWASEGGTVFTNHMNWAQSNTDGMVVGSLPVGFTIVGQFTEPPTGLGGWEVISGDGSRISLSLVPGQRVRLDVALHVRVRQDH